MPHAVTAPQADVTTPPIDIPAVATERMEFVRRNRLRLGRSTDDGQLVTLEPFVRATAFAVVAGLIRIPDIIFHRVTQALHFKSWFAVAAGVAAAMSETTQRLSARVDAVVLPVLAPVFRPVIWLWQRPALRPARDFAARVPGDLRAGHFVMHSGLGRFVNGASTILLGTAVVALFLPVSAPLALAVAGVSGAMKWGLPHLDDRWPVVERIEDGFKSVWAKLRTRVGRPQKAEPATLDDPSPFAADDRESQRHLKIREAYQVTTAMAGQAPPRGHAGRPLWFRLATLVKKGGRGTPEKLSLLAGEGIPESAADLLTELALADVAAGGNPRGLTVDDRGRVGNRFDLSMFGEVTNQYLAAALRLSRDSARNLVPAAEPGTAAASRKASSVAERVAQLFAGGAVSSPDPMLVAATKLVGAATDKREGLWLHDMLAAKLAGQLADWTDRTGVEFVDVRGWHPETAQLLTDAVAARAHARSENPAALQRTVDTRAAGRTLAADSSAEAGAVRQDPAARREAITDLRARLGRQAPLPAPVVLPEQPKLRVGGRPTPDQTGALVARLCLTPLATTRQADLAPVAALVSEAQQTPRGLLLETAARTELARQLGERFATRSDAPDLRGWHPDMVYELRYATTTAQLRTRAPRPAGTASVGAPTSSSPRPTVTASPSGTVDRSVPLPPVPTPWTTATLYAELARGRAGMPCPVAKIPQGTLAAAVTNSAAAAARRRLPVYPVRAAVRDRV